MEVGIRVENGMEWGYLFVLIFQHWNDMKTDQYGMELVGFEFFSSFRENARIYRARIDDEIVFDGLLELRVAAIYTSATVGMFWRGKNR